MMETDLLDMIEMIDGDIQHITHDLKCNYFTESMLPMESDARSNQPRFAFAGPSFSAQSLGVQLDIMVQYDDSFSSSYLKRMRNLQRCRLVGWLLNLHKSALAELGAPFEMR